MSRKDRFAEEEKRLAAEMERKQSSNFDRIKVEQLPKFDDGEERILRILPTREYMQWLLTAKDGEVFDDDAFPYAEKWVHFKVGKSGAAFACLSKHNNEPCPICDERTKLYGTGDSDDKKEADGMKIANQFDFFVCWRGHEDQPYRWTISPQWANMVVSLFANKDYNDLDDPEEGHDIKVKRTGKGYNDTKYVINPRPKPCPLFEGDDGDLDMEKMRAWVELLPEISESAKPFMTYEEGEALLMGASIGDVMKARAKENGTDFDPKEIEREEPEPPRRSSRRR